MKTAEKTLDVVSRKVAVNASIKSNPKDPFIQKKVAMATKILREMKEPI